MTPLHLWALAVGLVISGEYFGWNFGWEVAGTIGFLIATLFVTILYITLVFSLTELATRIPKADGPFAYSMQAFGPIAGITAGYATLIEFLFAPPAISIALGSYVNFLFPEIPVLSTAIFCFIFSTIINIIGIKESALFNLMITVLAIGELMIFFGILIPHFELRNFVAHNETFGIAGIFAALP